MHKSTSCFRSFPLHLEQNPNSFQNLKALLQPISIPAFTSCHTLLGFACPSPPVFSQLPQTLHTSSCLRDVLTPALCLLLLQALLKCRLCSKVFPDCPERQLCPSGSHHYSARPVHFFLITHHFIIFFFNLRKSHCTVSSTSALFYCISGTQHSAWEHVRRSINIQCMHECNALKYLSV